jgi:hypothetical protein
MLSLLGSSSADAMALAPGNLVVAYTDGLIAQFDPAGDVVDGFFSFLEPSGVEVTRSGDILVLEGWMIHRLSAAGVPLGTIASPVSGFYDEGDVLAVGPGDELFLLDDTTVYVLDEIGAFVDFLQVPGLGAAPYGTGLAARDNGEIIAALYYYNDRNSQIFRLARDGAVLDTSELIEGRILGVTVDEDDDVLYATDAFGAAYWPIGVTITRLDSSWAVAESWTLPTSGYGLGGLATVPAPEPAASLQFACAFTALAWLGRRTSIRCAEDRS